MAEVKFKRIESSSNINSIPVIDGQIIYTKDGKTYTDYGTSRVVVNGTPDTTMSDSSTNAIANSTVKQYIDSNKSIYDSGSNYIRYRDGTMIYFGRQTANTNINSSWGNSYISPLITLNNYPYAFTSEPAVTITVQGSEGAWIMNGDTGLTTRPQKIYLVRGASLSNNANFYINTIAVGKWQ